MKAKFKIIPAIILLTAGLAFNAAAQSGNPVVASASVTATIITPLTLVKEFDMNFGNITATTAGGTVVLSPLGARLADGVQLPATTGDPLAASFDVSGEASYAYTLSLPTAVYTLTGDNTGTMDISLFTSSLQDEIGVLDVNGDQKITVGSTLTLGLNQPSGMYTNATGFTVSVVYN